MERKPRGISIDGRDVSASPRWMQWNRVLDVLTPLASPQFLFEVEITSMRALTLDIGVAETTQSQNLSLDESYKANCREWYVDGAGRAVQKVRNRDKDEVSFAFGRRYGVGRVVGVYRAGPASASPWTAWTWGSPSRTCRAAAPSCASRRAACTDRGARRARRAGPDPDERRAAAGPLGRAPRRAAVRARVG